jgi:hypothetical protein
VVFLLGSLDRVLAELVKAPPEWKLLPEMQRATPIGEGELLLEPPLSAESTDCSELKEATEERDTAESVDLYSPRICWTLAFLSYCRSEFAIPISIRRVVGEI